MHKTVSKMTQKNQEIKKMIYLVKKLTGKPLIKILISIIVIFDCEIFD